ncbi:MAG: glutaredoxin 3 [Pseudomonadota bacterium]
MAEIEIYTSPFCPYCWRAKRLLSDKGLEFTEVDVLLHPGRRAEMIEKAEGRTSVPQIFIDGRGIGGSDELSALESSGELESLIADSGANSG